MKNLANVIYFVFLFLAGTAFAGEKVAVSEASKDPFFQSLAGVWTLSEAVEGTCAKQVLVDVQKGYVSQLDAVVLYAENKNSLLYRFSALNAGTYYFWGKAIQESLERAKTDLASAYTLKMISRGYTFFGADERISLTGQFSRTGGDPVRLYLNKALSQSSYLTVLKSELQDCVYTKEAEVE